MIEIDIDVVRTSLRLPAGKVIRSVETYQGSRAEYRGFVAKVSEDVFAALDVEVGQATACGIPQHTEAAKVVAILFSLIVKINERICKVEQIPGPHRKSILTGRQGI